VRKSVNASRISYDAIHRTTSFTQSRGQDVGKAGTDSFPLEETYSHFLNFKIQKQA
jgi:hypothetical protein